MKRIILVFTFLSISSFTMGQQEKNAGVQKNQVSAYFLPLKITYEHGIGRFNTLEFGTGITANTRFSETNVDFRFLPFVEGAFKYYYNLEKRSTKGKRIAMNSGNYWGLTTRYSFASLSDDATSNVLFVSPMWGIQRNYKSHISLGFNLGYGVGFENSQLITSPFLNFKLGFVLFNR